MMNKEIEKIINEFCNAAIEKGGFQTPKNTDRRLFKKMCSSYLALTKYGETGFAAFCKLLNHENDYVRSWVASQILFLDSNDRDALKVLKNLSEKEDVVSISAEIVLKQNNEKKLLSPFGEYGKYRFF